MPVHCTRLAPLSDSIEQFNSVSKVPNIPVQMVAPEDKVRVVRWAGGISVFNVLGIFLTPILQDTK